MGTPVRRRLVGAIELAQQVRSRRVEEVVVVEPLITGSATFRWPRW